MNEKQRNNFSTTIALCYVALAFLYVLLIYELYKQSCQHLNGFYFRRVIAQMSFEFGVMHTFEPFLFLLSEAHLELSVRVGGAPKFCRNLLS